MSYHNGLDESAYRVIEQKANSNMLFQGASAIFGGFVAAGVDVAVIGTHYVPMFNNIRGIYGRDSLKSNYIAPIITNMYSECLFDLAFDKILGYVPLLGIYTNAMAAKTLTWRLGVLFTMLARRSEDVRSDDVRDCIYIIRDAFPQNDAFRLSQPDIQTFLSLIDVEIVH